jgi:hypothetical protein
MLKSLLVSGLVMVNVWNVWAINESHIDAYPYDMDRGIIIVRNGKAMIDNGQYYNHITFRGLDDLK